MQTYTIFFITVNALHVSGGCWNNSPTLAVAASKLDIYLMLCVQFFELLMMGGETA
jgi:hypothetical protein